ncbi:MAG: DUF1232 domain-containing protein [Anaerolineae bacterium]|nr:DUF1232 domain-containing protein [Anaerolineae bacterium]
MAGNDRSSDSGRAVGLLSEVVRQARLVLRLLKDGRVPVWPKLIIPGVIVYILSPIDLLADPILGLGQIDDVAVLLIGLKLFVELCPTDIVREHLDSLASVIDGSYRVVEEQQEQRPETPELSQGESDKGLDQLPGSGDGQQV